jgi:hypothetical protein
MSINLSVAELCAEATRFGNTPYLLSQSDDGRPHAVGVTITWRDTDIVSSSGTRSANNVQARPLISLLWPPVEAGGYSLIVDGVGRVIGEGADRRIVVEPTRGVLHRSGPAPTAQAGGCGADCVPLLG